MANAILVTGAAGFIGSHLTAELVRRGDRVVGLDNLNDYYDPARKRANLAEIEATRGGKGWFRFLQEDIRDREAIPRLFRSEGIVAVAHLAAMAGVRVSIDAPDLYYDVNLMGTLNLLEAARRHGIRNFVLASTSSVYGNTRTIPFVETDVCDRPLAPYAASKRAAEMLGFTYHHLYGLDVTVLRFFTVYGPRGRPDMMAFKVADNIFFGREVPIYDNGRMHRDWTYVGDIAQGIMAAIDRPLGYEIINLGRGEPVLLADFVRLIEESAGQRARLVPAPMPETDIPYTFADIGKARRLLDYDPGVSVKQGVARFWDWYQQAVLGRPSKG